MTSPMTVLVFIFFFFLISRPHQNGQHPGGSHIDIVYLYVPALLGSRCFFTNFGIAIVGFHHRWRCLIYINSMYFEQIMVKEQKVPNLSKLGVLFFFFITLVYWWVVNGDKNMNSESQNFKVRQAHPPTKFLEPPLTWYIPKAAEYRYGIMTIQKGRGNGKVSGHSLLKKKKKKEKKKKVRSNHRIFSSSMFLMYCI